MNVFEAIFLGLVQGLSEFIPISSSGHLVVAQALLGKSSDHLFLEAINMGTFVALLIYFAPKIIVILKDIFVGKNYTLARNIILTSIPAGLVGYLAADYIDNSPFFGSLWVIVVTLTLVGIVMIVLEKLPKLTPVSDGSKLSPLRSLLVGLAQMCALIPGVSRSGATIVTGRLVGLSPKEAAEYSFLASLPIMLGVTIKTILHDHDYLAAHASMLIVGNLAALISGLLAVRFLMKYLSSHDLKLFGWYRIGLAAVLVGVLLLH